MNGNEYQRFVMELNDYNDMEKINLFAQNNGNATTGLLLNGVLGLTEKSGNVASVIKKGIFNKQYINKESLKEDCGNVLKYLSIICAGFGFTMDEIMNPNILTNNYEREETTNKIFKEIETVQKIREQTINEVINLIDDFQDTLAYREHDYSTNEDIKNWLEKLKKKVE